MNCKVEQSKEKMTGVDQCDSIEGPIPSSRSRHLPTGLHFHPSTLYFQVDHSISLSMVLQDFRLTYREDTPFLSGSIRDCIRRSVKETTT